MTTRRSFLRFLAGAPLFAAGLPAQAREAVIPRLINQSREHGDISQRIDFISRALLGTRYEADTLIGGPQQKELFVLRDDAFDCVTYCEAVLAAAIAPGFPEYAHILRRIRYAQGRVSWEDRNHDFAQWSRRIVENKICRTVGIAPPVTVEKTLQGGGLGRRSYVFAAIPTPAFMANQKALRAGDIIGFVSRRPDLDFFHTGFIAFGKRNELLLRHASQSRRRVLNEDMTSFVAATNVPQVTVLRAEDRALA